MPNNVGNILIQSGRVIDPANGIDAVMDVHLQDGRIRAVGLGLDVPGARVVPAAGRVVLPGLIDIHCHLRDPGYEYKEDMASGTHAAARGGFTSVVCMANTRPVADNAAVISSIVEKARREGVVRVYPVGAATRNLAGEELAEMGEMKAAGAVAISDDGKPIVSGGMMRKVLEYASGLGLVVMSHCEDAAIADGGVMNEGYWSTVLGLKGANRAAEESMLARDILLAQSLNAAVHIQHVTTRAGVALVREAKRNGVRVTAETCPHYLAATDEAVCGYDTNTRVNPPLRTAQDQAALLEGLADGTIDVIATDHAPHHIDEKRVEYDLAASGIAGFETAFALCYTQLVRAGHLSLSQLVERMSQRPAALLGLPGGTLGVGKAADIVIADIDEEYSIDVNQFLSKARNNPFGGRCVYGRILHTFVAGKRVGGMETWQE